MTEQVKHFRVMESREIADELDGLERRALALYSAIQGLEALNNSVRNAVGDLAYDLSEALRTLSDKVHPCPPSPKGLKA